MKTKNSLISFVFLITLILSLITFVQASSSSVGIFLNYNKTDERYLKIYEGDNIGIIVTAFSVLEKYMTINVDLLDENYNLINNLIYAKANYQYDKYYVFGQEIYGQPGTYIIRAEVTSATGDYDVEYLYLEIIEYTPENHAPVIISTPITEVNENEFYSYQVIATDKDNDKLTYTLTQFPNWLSINSNGLIFGISPELDKDYQFAVTVEVSDGKDFDRQFFTLDVIDTDIPPEENHPPIITSFPINQVNENEFYKYQVIALDEDNDPLIYTLTEKPNWLSIDKKGLISGTAPEVSVDKQFTVTVKVSDSIDFDTQTYILTVKDTDGPEPENHTPVAYDSYYETLVNIAVKTIMSATDQDGDALEYIITQEPSHGDLSGTGNSRKYTPDTDFVGTDSYKFKVFDGQDYSNEASVFIEVKPLEDDTTPPVITIISPEPKTYYVNDILFKITTNEPVTSAWFSLDNGDDVFMNKNGNTFTYFVEDLDNGFYDVVFYAKDNVGNIGQASVSFSIDVEDDNGDDYRKRGKGSIGYKTYIDEYMQKKYFEQFEKKPAPTKIDEKPEEVEKPKKFPVIWLILLIVGIIILLIFIFYYIGR